MRVPSRERLFSEYARKPVRRFVQIDCWEECSGSTVLLGDGERYVDMGGETYELRNTDFPVRIQIADGADKEMVLELLAQAYRVLSEDWDAYSGPSGRPPLTSSGEQHGHD